MPLPPRCRGANAPGSRACHRQLEQKMAERSNGRERREKSYPGAAVPPAAPPFSGRSPETLRRGTPRGCGTPAPHAGLSAASPGQPPGPARRRPPAPAHLKAGPSPGARPWGAAAPPPLLLKSFWSRVGAMPPSRPAAAPPRPSQRLSGRRAAAAAVASPEPLRSRPAFRGGEERRGEARGGERSAGPLSRAAAGGQPSPDRGAGRSRRRR